MDNNNISDIDNHTNNKQQISTPTAIIVAGIFIMIGIIVSKGNTGVTKPKTLSEQVGVSNASLQSCIKSTDATALSKSIDDSVNSAMSNVTQRGTPYSVVIGLNGVKTDVRGAETYENMKKIVDDAMIGKVTTPYIGNIVLSEPDDHIMGNADAKVTVIEYSDFECPYCKQFQPVMEQIMKDDAPNVRWIYRNYPIHQDSFAMLTAAECVAKLGGNDAYWKYANLLFGLQDKQNTYTNNL